MLINFRYTTPDPVLPLLDEAWLDVGCAYGVSVWVLIAGLVALAVLSLGVVAQGHPDGEPVAAGPGGVHGGRLPSAWPGT